MKRLLFSAVVLFACRQAFALSVLELPGESCTNAPVSHAPFPDRLSAFVWRNWFCVDKSRLAEVVGAAEEDLTSLAVEMGLPPNPSVEPEWGKRGYFTVIRRNWHLLDYGQMLALLGWTRERMHYHLLNDDYMFSKLGRIKPKCGMLTWNAAEAEKHRTARRRIAAILKEEGADDFSGEPRFGFLGRLSSDDGARARTPPGDGWPRISTGYFADCLDPLWDDEIGSFPDGLLARYADAGVNGIWLHVVLRTLAKDPFFVEFGEGAGRRQRNLRRLVERAAKHGIKVYLYLNEPRPMPPSFFEKDARYQACRGTMDWTGLECAMCTHAPEVRRWLRSAIGEVFRSAPGLGGVFTITASEKLVHCLAHGNKKHYAEASLREPTCRPEFFCPRCEGMDFSACAADLNAQIADAVHAVDRAARVYVWDWGWDRKPDGTEVAEKMCRLLPTEGVSFLTISARGKPVDVGGTPTMVNEYTLSQVGPSDAARRKWAAARASGIDLAAKVQPSGSWEIASVPYIPVMYNVAEHAFNLRGEGIGGFLLSWTCGSYPAPNLKVFNGVKASDKSPADVLRRVSEELYGPVAAPLAMTVWKTLSDGFSRYPFTSRVLYHGPHHIGAANPLYVCPTGYASTMTGIPYDDLDGWRRIFPRKTYISRFDEMAASFSRGAEDWKAVVAAATGDGRRLARQELGIIRMIALNFASTADQSRFVEARERGEWRGMLGVARRELRRAKELLPIVSADSRLGYESASQYFFIPQDLREKIVGCRFMIEAEENDSP